ncbi:MAG: DUF459 domain-containing protein, partial [Bradyrhizobium sp.]
SVPTDDATTPGTAPGEPAAGAPAAPQRPRRLTTPGATSPAQAPQQPSQAPRDFFGFGTPQQAQPPRPPAARNPNAPPRPPAPVGRAAAVLDSPWR